MRTLVTGGAGFIGSFMVKSLLDRGDEVTVFDNLKRGHKEAIDPRAKFLQGDITNLSDIDGLFGNGFDSLIHFAGLIAVGESEKEPELYYKNNVEGSKILFEAALKNEVKNIIFSSSAAVYGNPSKVPIPEDHPTNPTSQYGRNKLEVEGILADLRSIHPEINFACLRYFNAAGAALDGELGEAHLPETHIIPKIIESLQTNQSFQLFGDDYPTPDGTCIRDYIHVLDLVNAHVLAIDFLTKHTGGGFYYNVGTGNGFSNRQVIEEIEKITGEKINVSISPRREGDSSELVADPTRIKHELGFSPQYSDLETIVKTAWNWHKNNKW